MTAHTSEQVTPVARPALLTVGAAALVAIGLVAASFALGATTDAGHAQFHAISALVLLAVAAALLRWRPGAGAAIVAPATGLALFGVSVLVEGIGAFGYAPNGGDRINGLAAAHDLGVTLTGLGMLAVVVGIGVGIGVALDRRASVPRWFAVLVALVVIVPGSLVVRIMTAGF